MGFDPALALQELKDMFRSPALDSIAGGLPPRTTISDALVATFSDMLAVIRPSLVLEIGAHDASFSCAIKKTLPASEVIAFEANPHVFKIYSEVAKVKNSGVRYLLNAVSDVDGEVELIIPTSVVGYKKPLHNMMGSLNRLGLRDIEDETVSVSSVTLDRFLADNADQSIAVWIDVEGAVDRVLAGATSIMPRAQAVICEVEIGKVWQGQAIDNDIIASLAQWDLVPILCDCQKKFQYNLILVKSNLLDNAEIQQLVAAFPAKAAAMLETLVA